MKSKVATIAALAVMAMGSAFGATVSINFNGDFDTFVPQNFANAAGTVSNGLIWGIVVDGGGNGLITTPSLRYDQVAKAAGQSYVLSVAGAATDDVLYIAQGLTANTSGSTEGDFSTPGGNGGIYGITGVTTDLNGVATGDKFYVVWFDTAGGVAGTLTDASFLIPANGASVDLTAPFAGVDPIRTAGLAYVGTSGTSTGAGIAFVPEPSTALLGAIGALGLLRRRRI
jgi:hypothetical protein